MNMHKMTEDKPSIDDILDSIKNTIQNKDNKPTNQFNNDVKEPQDDSASELRLTEIVSNWEDDDVQPEENKVPEEESSMVSNATAAHTEALLKDFAETAESLGREVNVNTKIEKKEDKIIEKFILELLEPQMKEWLNTNLPLIVKEVVSEEIKKLVANMNNKD